MTVVPEQSFTFFVCGVGKMSECLLHVDADSTLDSIRDEMVEAGVIAAGYGTIFAKLPNGDLAQACLSHGGIIKWDLLTGAIRKAEAGVSVDALTGWLSNTSDINIDPFDGEYLGCWGSLADYASDHAVNSGELAQVPERLREFVDFARVGRKMVADCEVWTYEMVDGVHIYRS